MIFEYETTQFDTWDVLALDIYGTEMLAWLLQKANPQHIGTLYFPAGVILVVPETPKAVTNLSGPPWQRNKIG